MSKEIFPSYKNVKYFLEGYARDGALDKRAVETFAEIEANEMVRSLRTELIAMSQGKFHEETLDLLVGVKRKARHGSYVEWAKLMLLWIAGVKR